MTIHFEQHARASDVSDLVSDTLAARRTEYLYAHVFKRSLDILLVLLAAPAVLAVVGVLSILIALDGGKPFYGQARVGRNGSTFRMWKLRSMVDGADALLAAHLEADPKARAEWARTQKLRHDPRITRLGRFIRKSSLDELPQLWNVLIGEMSLVGPRPMMVEQQSIYPGSAYYALRPGITGFWQTSVRNESSFAERATYDSAYLRALSFRTDVLVLLRTVRVVLRPTGC